MKKSKHFYCLHKAIRNRSAFRRICERRKYKQRFRSLPSKEREKLLEVLRFKHKYWNYNTIKAPRIFSLIENEDETLEFIKNVISSYEKRRKTFINLRFVDYITNDALLLLLSNMVRFKTRNIDFNGNFPKNINCERMVMNSGFFESLYDTIKRGNSYDLAGKSSSFHTHANKKVDQQKTAEIIERACRTIWNEPKRCPKVQRAFIELMQNTNNHAADEKGKKHWWMSVSHDYKNKKVVISFLDFGMGIIRSLENKKVGDKFYKWQEIFKQYWPWAKSHDQILKLILEGALYNDIPATVTGDYNRGKGLPGIYKAFKENNLVNLVVITNNVYANVGKGDFHVMKNEFLGTFVSWEMNESINYLPWIE